MSHRKEMLIWGLYLAFVILGFLGLTALLIIFSFGCHGGATFPCSAGWFVALLWFLQVSALLVFSGMFIISAGCIGEVVSSPTVG